MEFAGRPSTGGRVPCARLFIGATRLLAYLLSAVASAEDGRAAVSERIELGDAVVADIQIVAGCLYAVEADGSQRLVIVGLRSLGSQDFDAKGALRAEDPSTRFAALHRLANPEEMEAGGPAKRVVGAIRHEILGSLPLKAPLKRLQVVGNKVFVVSSPAAKEKDPPAKLFEVEVSNASSPKLVQSLDLPIWQVEDMVVDAQHLVVCGQDKVLVYQIPGQDKPKSEVVGLQQVKSLALTGTSLFVGCRDGLRIYDLKVGEAKLVGRYECPPVEKVFLEKAGNVQFAYLFSPKGDGVAILDVTKPDAMKRVGTVGQGRRKSPDRVEEASGMGVFSTSAKGYSARQLCVGELGFGLKVFDITRPEKPRFVGGHPVSAKNAADAPFPVCVDGAHAYVGGRGGVEAVLLGAGIHLDFAHEFVADMDRAGDYLYVIESEGTKQLYIYRVLDSFPEVSGAGFAPPACIGTYRLETPEDTDMEQPGERITGMKVCTLVGNIVLGVPLKRVKVVGDKAFIASSPAYELAGGEPDPTDQEETGPPKLFEVDVSNKNEPRAAKSVRIPLKKVADMTADGDRVFLAGDDKLLAYNALDLEKPVCEADIPGVSGLFVDKEKLFVGCADGLRIYGLEKDAIRQVGHYPSKPVGALFVSGVRAFLCHPEKGGNVEVVDVSDPAKVRRLGEIGRNLKSVYWGIEHPLDIEVRGNLACVADYCFGLKVFDISNLSKPVYLGGHYRFSRWWKVVSFRVCTDETHAYVGLRAALEIVNLPVRR